MKTTIYSKSKLESIQIIRALGCLMVILCHSKYTDYGQTGVDYFLVISGFVMMLSTRGGGVKRYWSKRIKRIIPLYYVLTAFTAILVLIKPNYFNSYEVSTTYFIKSLLFIPYYHNEMAGPIIQIAWTLNYEMFFYLLFFIGMVISFERRGLVTIIEILILQALNFIFPNLPMPLSYWCNPILLEFAYGIIVFYVAESIKKNLQISKGVLLLIWGTGTIMMEYLHEFTSIHRAFHVGVIAAIILLIFIKNNDEIASLQLAPAMVYIGNISYAIYLSHPFVVRGMETILNKYIEAPFLIVTISIFISICVGATLNYTEAKILNIVREK